MVLLDRQLYQSFRSNKISQGRRTPAGVRFAAVRGVVLGEIIIAACGFVNTCCGHFDSDIIRIIVYWSGRHAALYGEPAETG
jgi:hypothetical protein